MDIDKIRRIVIVQDVIRDENNYPVLDENGHTTLINKGIYIFRDGMTPVKELYDVEKHGNMFADYLESKGIDLNNPEEGLELAERQGLFERYDSSDIDKMMEIEEEYIDDLQKYPPINEVQNDLDDIDLENTEEDKKLSKKAKAGIAAGIVGAAAIAGGIGAYHVAKNKDKDEDNKQSTFENKFDELMSEFEEDHPRRVFAQDVFNAVEQINLNTGKSEKAVYTKNANGENEYFFSLKEDVSFDKDGKTKDEYLQFTFDEIMAAKIILNNYSEEQLFEIFGDKQLDSQEIMNQYQSFASKLELYYMNAKAPSGVASLIEDETNRDWFQKIESSIIEFNKDVNQQNADKVIRTFEYLYEYDVNGTDNVKSNQASINTIKNIGFHMVTGYYNANAASDEYTKYLTVASEPGEFDKQFQTEKLAQVQKGEKLKDILSRAEKGKCTMSLVQEQIDSTITRLSKEQTEKNSASDFEELYKTTLVSVLIDSGNPELANEVLNLQGEMSEDLRNRVKKEGKEAKNALEAYDNASVLNDLPSYDQIKEVADSVLGPYADLNITVIMVNRQRGKTLDLDKTSGGKGISKDEWNKMSKDEQLDYAKENGKVVSKKESVTEKKVSEKDLTPQEKESAKKQIDEMKKGNGFKSDNTGKTVKVEVDLSTYEGQGAKDGYNWGTSGNYTYSGTIVNDINPEYPHTLYSNGKGELENTYYDIARAAYAYEGVTITASESDASIKRALDKDIQEFKSENASVGSDAVGKYKEGWLKGVNSVLDAAVKAGKLERSKAEKMYADAKKAAEKSVETVNSNPIVDNHSIDTNKSVDADNYVASEKPVTDTSDGVYNEDPNLNSDTSNDNFVEAGEGFHEESYVALSSPEYVGSSIQGTPMVDETPIVEENSTIDRTPIVSETPVVEEKSTMSLDSRYYDLVAELAAAELAEQSVAPVEDVNTDSSKLIR